MQEISITRPDDWHVHLRDGSALSLTATLTAKYFGRAIIMPNLQPPVVNTTQALEYRKRILESLNANHSDPGEAIPSARKHTFSPLMVLYLTDITSPEEIKEAAESEHVYAVKLYPAGATTNSSHGVTDIQKTYACLEMMSELGIPLLIHGEVTDTEVDIFDREHKFIDESLLPLIQRFPNLKVVLEHITTQQAVNFVCSSSANVAATITPQHLMYNRNQLLVDGIKPHYYCLPILKRKQHQQALRDVLISGNSKFFLGTDSAPHTKNSKENACGCAGCFTAHAAIELYAEVFDSLNAMDKLEAFASFYGPDFYGLQRNSDHIILRKQAWTVPNSYDLGGESLIPLKAGETVQWSVVND